MSIAEYFYKSGLEWSDDLVRELKKMIVSHGHEKTGQLLDSVVARVYETGGGVEIELFFAEWGRMVDMGKGRPSLGETVESNGNFYSFKGKRKPDPWYSRTTWGMMDRLQTQLMYGYSEQIQASVWEALQVK